MTSGNRSFSGKVALVTGGARGIGAEVSHRLAIKRCSVVLLDIAETELNQMQESLRSQGVSVDVFPVDITDDQALTRTVSAISQRYGRLDIVVHNAGISPKHEGRKLTVAEMDLGEWRKVLDVNLTAVFRLSQLAIPLMARHSWGRIINISSQAGRTRSEIAGAHYAASKAGLLGFARILAQETAHLGITVNSIAPGRIATAMADEAGSEVNASYTKGIPVGRLGCPNDVATAVEFLASDEASFITGAILDVNGGYFMP